MSILVSIDQWDLHKNIWSGVFSSRMMWYGKTECTETEKHSKRTQNV